MKLIHISHVCWATWRAVKGCERAIKWPYLANLSTTTIITSCLYELGRPSMKSMLTTVQGREGTGNGCKRPGLLTCSTLAY